MRHLNTQYFSDNQLKEVAAPTESSDAATKGYVDGTAAGLYRAECSYDNLSSKHILDIDLQELNGRAIIAVLFTTDCDLASELWYEHGGTLYTTWIYTNATVGYAGRFVAGELGVFLMPGPDSLMLLSRSNPGVSAKQDILVGSGTGQNIKTVNGKSLPGTGNIALGKGVAVINNTAAADNYGAMECELITAGMDLTETGGIVILAYFNHDVPANGRLTITDGGSATVCLLSDISYPDSLNHSLSAGDIKAGDVCLLQYFYNGASNVTWFLANLTRNVFPSFANNAGKILSVNSGESGVEWKTPGFAYLTHNVDTSLTTDLTLICNDKTHHHVHVDSGVNGISLIVDVRNNLENVVTVDFKDARDPSLERPVMYVGVYKNGSPVSRQVSCCSDFGNNILKSQSESNGRLRTLFYLYGTSNQHVSHIYLKISAAVLNGTTYGFVNATPMLCSELT